MIQVLEKNGRMSWVGVSRQSLEKAIQISGGIEFFRRDYKIRVV